MIDTKELREKITIKGLDVVADTDILVVLDRLEAAKTAWKEADKACRDLTEKVIPNIREQLESAEKERDELRTENVALVEDMNLLRNNNMTLRAKVETAENDAAHQKALAESALRVAEGWERKCGELRAKIARMEQQEPVAWRTSDGEGGYDYRSYEDNENYKLEWDARNPNHIGWVEPLYTLPGAQNVPDFADAYQGAMEEVAIWKKRALEAEDLNRKFIAEINGPTHMGEPVQNVPSVQNGWLRAIDEALVVAHIGVANPSDTYEQARVKLDNLIGFHTDAATDPSVNGGWKLVPIEPTEEMLRAMTDPFIAINGDNRKAFESAYKAMLAAAPEAKP